MKEFIEKHTLTIEDAFSRNLFTEEFLFFDIETTGFSARHNKIYFIGCAYRTGDEVIVKQFFSETDTDEPDVLSAFLTLCSSFQTLISFNGLGFDLPFIQERCRHFQLSEALASMTHIDIFKQISSLKKIFKLENLKQKSIEKFLNLNRKDVFTGGELINVYYEYLKDFSTDKLYLLQLHNKEDVLGMLDILPILTYSEFFKGNFELDSFEINQYYNYHNSSKTHLTQASSKPNLEHEETPSLEVIFSLKLPFHFPKRISYGVGDIYLSGYEDTVHLKVKIYQGELKYFYSNYKDYYYLPHEDVAIHKSVAFYVDKDFRTKAKAATCYSKKTGRFLPQYSDVFSPYFKLEYHDKISYIEMTEEFTNSKEYQKNYVMHLLGILLK